MSKADTVSLKVPGKEQKISNIKAQYSTLAYYAELLHFTFLL